MVTKFENCSSTHSVEIMVTQTEIPNTVPIDTSSKLIKPGSVLEIQKTFDGGCARMSVWSIEKGRELLWDGVIPLESSVIKIYPEEKKVTTDDGAIPRCVSESNGNSNEGGKPVTKKLPTWWWIILVLTILLGVAIFFLR